MVGYFTLFNSLHLLLNYVEKILILIFAEVLGLYGLIVALIMNTKAQAMQVC